MQKNVYVNRDRSEVSNTGDKGPVVARPYRYDRQAKALLIITSIRCYVMVQFVLLIRLTHLSRFLTRKKNDLPPDSPEAYRFAIDYRKLNGITKYPRYPLPV
ncbi:hypothetical protein TNCV_174411 [Trichonephila clavipes]|nr:hypothetical protein TNCV_174411 [Trichonephila clavipes]